MNVTVGEWRFPRNAYRVRVVLVQEEDGFSVFARDLPGAASQGDTIEEALANIRDACTLLIESYQADGRPIPWIWNWADDTGIERVVTVETKDTP